jgi:hypothetical protein
MVVIAVVMVMQPRPLPAVALCLNRDGGLVSDRRAAALTDLLVHLQHLSPRHPKAEKA